MNVRARRAIDGTICFFAVLFFGYERLARAWAATYRGVKELQNVLRVGKNQREERALPRSQNPHLRAKKWMRVRSIARAVIILSPTSPNFFRDFLSLSAFFAFHPIGSCIGNRGSACSYAPPSSPPPGETATGDITPEIDAQNRCRLRSPIPCDALRNVTHAILQRNNRRRHTLIKRTHHTRHLFSHSIRNFHALSDSFQHRSDIHVTDTSWKLRSVTHVRYRNIYVICV